MDQPPSYPCGLCTVPLLFHSRKLLASGVAYHTLPFSSYFTRHGYVDNIMQRRKVSGVNIFNKQIAKSDFRANPLSNLAKPT